MESKNYYRYISGLKGFSCLLIMIGHFIGLYRFAEQFLPKLPLLDFILESRLSFIVNEGEWLYLFFLLSGFLVAKSQVKTVGELLLKILNRFFRFAFPIFFSYLIIYLVYILIGFHNVETASLFQCGWFQTFYVGKYSMMHVLRSPIDVLFLGKCVLNSPYWVLREMFTASIIIYILKYVHSWLAKKHEALYFSLLVLIVLLLSTLSSVITACLIGMIISLYENEKSIFEKSYFAFWAIVTSMLFYTSSLSYINLIFFLSLLVFIPKIKFADKIFSSVPFNFLGKISWGIYSFHWPVMCSLGAILIITLHSKAGIPGAYLTACIVCGLVSLFLSTIYYFTFERLSSYLSSAINHFMKKIISGPLA